MTSVEWPLWEVFVRSKLIASLRAQRMASNANGLPCGQFGIDLDQGPGTLRPESLGLRTQRIHSPAPRRVGFFDADACLDVVDALVEFRKRLFEVELVIRRHFSP